MVHSALAPRVQAPQASWWPRAWSDQCVLLERQHDLLESLLEVLIHDHNGMDRAIESNLQLACRRLVWDLRLHLRLEERWLQQHGCLCPAHHEAHRAVANQTVATLMAVEHDRQGRLALLQSIQVWFLAHRQGPDALAYGLAHQASVCA